MPIRPALRTKGKRREAARRVRYAVALTPARAQAPPSPAWCLNAAMWLNKLLTMTTDHRFRLRLEYRERWERPYRPMEFNEAIELAQTRGWEDD